MALQCTPLPHHIKHVHVDTLLLLQGYVSQRQGLGFVILTTVY
jgi:hypothetical protein